MTPQSGQPQFNQQSFNQQTSQPTAIAPRKGLAIAALILAFLFPLGVSAKTGATLPQRDFPLRGTLTFQCEANRKICYLDLATNRVETQGWGSSPFRLADGRVVSSMGTQLLLSSGDGLQQRKIVEGETHNPIVSPDNSKLAYERPNPKALGNQVVVLDLGSGQQIAAFNDVQHPTWTPDGRLIVAGVGDHPGLFLSDAALTNWTRIDNDLPKPEYPAVSPDGKHIAFSVNGHIYIMNMDGTDIRQITKGGGNERWPAWSPDGKYLAYADYITLKVVRLSDGATRTLKNGVNDFDSYGRITWRGDSAGAGSNAGSSVSNPSSVSNSPSSAATSRTSNSAGIASSNHAGGVLNGWAVSLPTPEYPPIAKAAHASGEVIVQVTVDETGKVISAHAVSGPPLLQGAAEAAARQARFSPTKLAGKPVKVTGVLTYNFIPE